MFSISGWSVNAPLKTQIEAPNTQKAIVESNSQKRKRKRQDVFSVKEEGKGHDKDQECNQFGANRNSGIEHLKKPKIRKTKNQLQEPQELQHTRHAQNFQHVQHVQHAQPRSIPIPVTAPVPKSVPIPNPPKNAAPHKLTKLQTAMSSKLTSARFRHLNEHLYTHPSQSSAQLFSTSPDLFTAYHQGFRNQVAKWPANPVQSFVRDVRSRAKSRTLPIRTMSTEKGKKEITIFDLGCGDAAFATTLLGKDPIHVDGASAWKARKPSNGGVEMIIHSFDLAANNSLVTIADVAHLPVPPGSADIVIFCLALMGINWVSFIDEAYRVLRSGGELWIAEIKSRFPRVGGSHAERKQIGDRKPKSEEDDEFLREEIDEDGLQKKETTDIQPFIEVLKKHGFELAQEKFGGKNIDLENKMFVKLRFSKNNFPQKKSNIKDPNSAFRHKSLDKKPNLKFIERHEDLNEENEAKVLKPCVYKLR